MARQSAVAGFATDAGMLAFGFHFSLIGVASFANLVSGELDRPGRHIVHRRRPEVSILSEIRGNDRSANQQEYGDPKGQQDGYTD